MKFVVYRGFSVNPSATLAPVFTTCEQPANNVLVIATTATPWHIFWTLDIFLSSIIVFMSITTNISEAKNE